jgi:hypothetical protein
MAPSLGCSSIPKVATGEEVKAQLEREVRRGEKRRNIGKGDRHSSRVVDSAHDRSAVVGIDDREGK